jgi:RNA polymerase sigma-70 factor (ECF subfamily)
VADIFDNWESEDDALMRQAAAGDAAAFGRIVRLHQGRISRFALRMLGGDHAEAEDATQETFLRLWRSRCKYQPQGNLIGLTLRIAANTCLDRRRSQDRELDGTSLDEISEVISTDPSPHDALRAATLADAVRDAVAKLPDPQRAVFLLSHYEHLSYREIAEALSCPIGTVASRKSLAVAALQKSIRPWIEEGD